MMLAKAGSPLRSNVAAPKNNRSDGVELPGMHKFDLSILGYVSFIAFCQWNVFFVSWVLFSKICGVYVWISFPT